MANPFEILVSNLTQLGFFGFLLPWLFVFAIFYGILLKYKTLGDDPKITGVVSLVVAFFVIGYGGPLIGTFMVNLFGLAAIVLAGILVTVLFVGMAGGDITKVMENRAAMAAVAGIGIIVFLAVMEGVSNVRIISSDVVSVLVVLIILGLAVVFISGGSK